MTNPAGDTTQYTTTHYHWEFQRHTNSFWAHQPGDQSGADRSDYTPEGFARQVLAQHAPNGGEPWRLAVWDHPGPGHLPVYTVTSEQAAN